MKSKDLLDKAKERLYEQSLMDAEDDNILYVLSREFDETHTHSKILFHVLSTPYKKDKSNSFLIAFLRQIGVPEQYIGNEKWTLYRERTFDDGRIDFVLESSQYVVAIEMQLSDRGTLSKRLFNYGTTLRYNNSFTNCLALGISVSSKVESNYTKLQKKTYSHIEDLEYLKTILINVDIELKRMEAGENIQINQQNLEEDGKEFIKLLGIRNWGTKCDNNRFALPEWDISENSVINECINILSEITDTKLSRMILDEQYFEDIKTENYNAGMDEGMKKGMNEGINKGLIIAAFSIFLEEKEDERAFQILKSNNVQVKGDGEIKKILRGKKNSDVNDFIEYLNNYNFFLNSS